jgi:hypothetical protein
LILRHGCRQMQTKCSFSQNIMDILTDYMTVTEKKKLVISIFFKKERNKIELYCNNLQPENKTLDLKLFWAEEISNFAIANPSIQVIFPSILVVYFTNYLCMLF